MSILNSVRFFCDGGAGFGMGHITRCTALAEEMQSLGLDVGFVVNGEAAVPGFRYENNSGTREWPEKAAGRCVVVDSYMVSGAEVAGIGRAAKAVLWLDDENKRTYPFGMLVNPSLFGGELGYQNPGVRHLVGAEAVILRRAFRRQFHKTVNRVVTELTLMMGGTDAGGMLPRFVDELDGLDCKLNIVGVNMPWLTAMEMAELFSRSDLVISAGGQTVYELIQTRTPSILVEAAENQRRNIQAVVARGLAVMATPGTSLRELVTAMDYDTRRRLSTAMAAYDFSGGAAHIVRSFLEGTEVQI